MVAYAYLELATGTSPGAYAYIEPGVFEVIEATIQSYLSGYDFVVVQNPLYIAGQKDISFYIGGYTAGHNTLISEALRAFILGEDVAQNNIRAAIFGHGVIQSSQMLLFPSDTFLTVVMEIITRAGDLEIEN